MKKKIKISTLIIIIALILALLASVTIGYMYLTKTGPFQQPSPKTPNQTQVDEEEVTDPLTQNVIDYNHLKPQQPDTPEKQYPRKLELTKFVIHSNGKVQIGAYTKEIDKIKKAKKTKDFPVCKLILNGKPYAESKTFRYPDSIVCKDFFIQFNDVKKDNQFQVFITAPDYEDRYVGEFKTH